MAVMSDAADNKNDLDQEGADISISIRRIILSNGEAEDLNPSGITVFVGPHSGGKSKFLAELSSAIVHYPNQPSDLRWIDAIELEQTGSLELFEAWFSRMARPVMASDGKEYPVIARDDAVYIPIDQARAPHGLMALFIFSAVS